MYVLNMNVSETLSRNTYLGVHIQKRIFVLNWFATNFFQVFPHRQYHHSNDLTTVSIRSGHQEISRILSCLSRIVLVKVLPIHTAFTSSSVWVSLCSTTACFFCQQVPKMQCPAAVLTLRWPTPTFCSRRCQSTPSISSNNTKVSLNTTMFIRATTWAARQRVAVTTRKWFTDNNSSNNLMLNISIWYFHQYPQTILGHLTSTLTWAQSSRK